MNGDGAIGRISTRGLIAVYAAIPLCLAVALADRLDGRGLLTELAASPATLLWYYSLLGLPHIAASFFSYASTDYLRHYRRSLTLAAGAALLASWLLLTQVSQETTLRIVVLFTIFHFVGQQIGIARHFIPAGRSTAYAVWRLALLGVGLLSGLSFPTPASGLTELILHIALLGSLLAWLRLSWGLPVSSVGYIYLLGTQVMFLAGWGLMLSGYALLAPLMFSLVHDLTAFQFYAAHDSVQHRQRGNALYRALRIPVQCVCLALPILAITCAAVLNIVAAPFPPLMLTLLHYAMEHRVWRGDTPHRRAVRISS